MPELTPLRLHCSLITTGETINTVKPSTSAKMFADGMSLIFPLIKEELISWYQALKIIRHGPDPVFPWEC